MDNRFYSEIFTLNAVSVLICATAYSKTDDNRVMRASLSFAKQNISNVFFYIFYHIILNLVSMDNVILNQNIHFKCGFSFDLCDGLQ